MSSPDLSGWLLTYLLHSTLLLSSAWLLAPRFRSHRVRDTLWKTALFGGILTATGQTLFKVSPLAGRMTVAEAAPRAAKVDRAVRPDQADPATGGSQPTPGPLVNAPAATSLTRGELLLGAWGAGAAVLLGLYLVRRIRFSRRIVGRRQVTEAPFVEMLDELCGAASIARPIRLTASTALGSPVALGTSEIALPEAALTDLDGGQQRSMLAHELAHLDRGDPSWLTAACIVERLGFFQPLNRLARSRMQESAEYLCDEWAVRRTGSGVLLAKCLAKVAEWLETHPRSVPVSGMAEDRSHLVARVRRLLDGAPFPAAPGRRTLVSASLAVMALTVLALPGVSLSRGASSVPRESAANIMSAGSSLTSLTPQAIADTGHAIVQALLGVLKDPDVEVRRAAVRSIANFEYPGAAAGLREALRDSDAEVRSSAVEGLGNLHDAASADAIAALIKDPNADVRANAIEALTELELKTSPTGLLEALHDTNADVRQKAVEAVGHFEDARAVPTLIQMLDDPNRDVRESAVEALGEIRNEAAIQGLIQALKAKDPKVRQAAADALGKH